MPLIQLNLMEQVSTPIQKKEIAGALTAALARFEGKRKRPVTATIEEICSPEWSIGGPARIAGAVPDFAASKK